ncbi:MAG: hypothetical protein ACKON7_08915, partial [Planctomycetaceae bacterium]
MRTMFHSPSSPAARSGRRACFALLAITLAAALPAEAQYAFSPIATTGPHPTTNWQNGFNLGVATSGTYSSYLIVTDWSTAAGDQWSSEAQAALHTAPLAAAPGDSYSGPVNSGTVTMVTFDSASGSIGDTDPRTNMFWTGALDQPFVANGVAPLYLSTRQTYAGSTTDNVATWTNLRVVLDPVVTNTTITTGAALPTAWTDLGTLPVGATSLSLAVSNTATGAAGISWYRFRVDSAVDSSNAFDFYTSPGPQGSTDTRLSLFRDSPAGLLPVASTDDIDQQFQSGLTFGSADASQFQRPAYPATELGWFDGRGGTMELFGYGAADGYYAGVPGQAALSAGDLYYLAVSDYTGARPSYTSDQSFALTSATSATITTGRVFEYNLPDSPLDTGNVLLSIRSQQATPTLQWYGDGVTPGGSGTWTLTGSNWWNGSSLQAWDPSKRAVFSGSAGVVELDPGIVASAGIQFGRDEQAGIVEPFVLTGAALTLGGSATAGVVAADVAALGIFDVPVVAANGYAKFGPGTVVMTGSTFVPAAVRVIGGEMTLSGGGTTTPIAGSFDVAPGADLGIDTEELTLVTGSIGGFGRFLPSGSGTVALAGDVQNVYTQLFFQPGGVLSVGIGGTTGSIGGTVVVGSNSVLAFNRSDASVCTAVLQGGGVVAQFGSGTTTLAPDFPYQDFTGTIAVVNGQLTFANTFRAPSAPTIDVASGAALDVTAQPGGYGVGPYQTLSGAGTVKGAVVVANGATLAPGASPGTLTVTGNATFGTGGNYAWQIHDAAGTAGSGTGWDLLSVGGTLAIASTSTDRFNINLWSLAGVGPDVSGSAVNFNPAQNYSWKIASAAGGITGFAANKFAINVSATNGADGFANSLSGGTFSVAQSGNDLNIVFTSTAAPPAPTTLTWY